ncbi:hypothetical protein P4278_31420 [Bacillus thuringiensis]|nr:hypothetical protein [Bacillus thuringiensis]MED2784110.1 hypothetical protein [Bacillus thuringiensis]
MKKYRVVLSRIAFIGMITIGMTQLSQTDQLATHGHYPIPEKNKPLTSVYGAGDYNGAPQQG